LKTIEGMLLIIPCRSQILLQTTEGVSATWYRHNCVFGHYFGCLFKPYVDHLM